MHNDSALNIKLSSIYLLPYVPSGKTAVTSSICPMRTRVNALCNQTSEKYSNKIICVYNKNSTATTTVWNTKSI